MSRVLLIRVINNTRTPAQVPSSYVQASTAAVIIAADVLNSPASRRACRMKAQT